MVSCYLHMNLFFGLLILVSISKTSPNLAVSDVYVSLCTNRLQEEHEALMLLNHMDVLSLGLARGSSAEHFGSY